MFIKICIILICIARAAYSDIKVKIVIIQEENDNVAGMFVKTLNDTEASLNNIQISEKAFSLVRADEEMMFKKVCSELELGVSLILDFTWSGWKRGKLMAESIGIPYLRACATIRPFIQVVDDTLTALRNATDAVLIFQDDKQVEQSLWYLMEFSRLRVLALNGLNSTAFNSLKSISPLPSFFVIIADTNYINLLFTEVLDAELMLRDDRWNLVITDFKHDAFNNGLLSISTSKFIVKKSVCCAFIELPETCDCPDSIEIIPAFIQLLSKRIGQVFEGLVKNENYTEPIKTECSDTNMSSNKWSEKFNFALVEFNKFQGIYFSPETTEVLPQLEFQISVSPNNRLMLGRTPVSGTKLATWKTDSGLQTVSGLVLSPVKRFFRIGTAKSVPWVYPVRNPQTGEIEYDSKGTEILEGYCIDFINTLAECMNFDYELVVNDEFGKKNSDGSWIGLVGDLSSGKTDIAVASMTMTSEREEVVDFVAPYFDQAGFSIVIRKPVRKTSLFKFMTVLRLEVWLSILSSLTITGIMIWFLDKYSPYSAQNNKKLYPYPCRKFTLKESFWFALTSFTPQGGGEAPKALSGRTLVAAYWLFVVLMLATFTANLAAFLTVERMQSPVESLDQLARQSRINYTVVANYEIHTYFKNMKNAEDTLYRMWKKITLDSSSVMSQYRVWDYPIKEQYGHILQAIERTGPVADFTEGIQKVLESEQGEFALIHDSFLIRYMITKNCNLTEIGDMFAEQPLAVAVQQGSQLNEEISRKILDLQKDRYFETLTAKYWNNSQKGLCHDSDDNEGITLESLGGVFIATLVGLALAMMTLCAEIIYHKQKKKNETISADKNTENVHFGILSKKEFGTSVKRRSSIIKPSVTYISVLPHAQLWQQSVREKNKK